MAPRSRHPKNATTHSAQFSPQMQDLVALADAARFQLAGEAIGVGQHIAVGPSLRTIAAMMDVGHLARVPVKVVEVFQDGGASHPRQCNCWRADRRLSATA